jgi:3-oxoadipate enol-lactonase
MGGDAATPAAKILENMISRTSTQGFISSAHALKSYDFTHVLPLIKCPVLALAGADDGAIPAAMREQLGALSNVRFEVIDGAGHLPNYQKPAAFNRVVADFLGRAL